MRHKLSKKEGGKNEDRILALFYENPDKEFTVREISNLTSIPRATAHKYLNMLKKQNIITKNNKASNSLFFKTKKINYFIEKLVSVGLIEYLIKELNPSAIVLFGSIRKGDSVKESDIDIFVETSAMKEANLKGYEAKLGHKIQIHREPDINKLHTNLLNNVVNGIKLYGSIKLR